MPSENEEKNMEKSVKQWQKLVDPYEDIETKKNAQRYAIFGKPFLQKTRIEFL
jgi:hypothetical protein